MSENVRWYTRTYYAHEFVSNEYYPRIFPSYPRYNFFYVSGQYTNHSFLLTMTDKMIAPVLTFLSPPTPGHYADAMLLRDVSESTVLAITKNLRPCVGDILFVVPHRKMAREVLTAWYSTLPRLYTINSRSNSHVDVTHSLTGVVQRITVT